MRIDLAGTLPPSGLTPVSKPSGGFTKGPGRPHVKGRAWPKADLVIPLLALGGCIPVHVYFYIAPFVAIGLLHALIGSCKIPHFAGRAAYSVTWFIKVLPAKARVPKPLPSAPLQQLLELGAHRSRCFSPAGKSLVCHQVCFYMTLVEHAYQAISCRPEGTVLHSS